MDISLGDVGLQLETESDELQAAWRQLFSGWPHKSVSESKVQFELKLVDAITAVPAETPLYSDVGVRPANEQILAVFAGKADHVWLHFFDGGLVCVPLAKTGKISGQVTREALNNGRFEDIVFTSLAPMLRRRGLFAVHAFAAARGETAVLLVGPSHSGKTTTGLNLLLHGWQMLANDIVLLQINEDAIVVALPTPGELSIRPPTYQLLPALADKQTFGWGKACRVTAVLFPKVQRGGGKTAVSPLPRAIALAQIMSESIDRWDNKTLEQHISVLEQLITQSATHQLILANDVHAIPNAIAHAIGMTI